MLITAISLSSGSWRRGRSQRLIKRRMKWRRSRGRGGRRWPREERSTSRGFSGKVMEYFNSQLFRLSPVTNLTWKKATFPRSMLEWQSFFFCGSLQERFGWSWPRGVAVNQNLLENPQRTRLCLYRQPAPVVEHCTQINAGAEWYETGAKHMETQSKTKTAYMSLLVL